MVQNIQRGDFRYGWKMKTYNIIAQCPDYNPGVFHCKNWSTLGGCKLHKDNPNCVCWKKK
jgi:hypothetical protein